MNGGRYTLTIVKKEVCPVLYILSKRKLLCLVPQPKGSSLTFGGLFTNSGATVLCMHVYMSIGVCVCVCMIVMCGCVHGGIASN